MELGTFISSDEEALDRVLSVVDVTGTWIIKVMARDNQTLIPERVIVVDPWAELTIINMLPLGTPNFTLSEPGLTIREVYNPVQGLLCGKSRHKAGIRFPYYRTSKDRWARVLLWSTKPTQVLTTGWVSHRVLETFRITEL